MNPSHDSVELTRALVAFDTINPPGNERPCAKHLGCLLEDGGFSVSYHELAEQRTSLVARIVGPSDTKPLCFTGHIDTVPLGAPPWTVDSFAGEISGGRHYGRGTSEKKSGVTAFVVAVLQSAQELLASYAENFVEVVNRGRTSEPFHVPSMLHGLANTERDQQIQPSILRL
jgi:succinyl-diaminopimelate desuccinylase